MSCACAGWRNDLLLHLLSQSISLPLPSSLSQKTGRTVEYIRSGQVHLGVVQAVPTAKSVDLKDIDGTKHRVAPDQLLSLWYSFFTFTLPSSLLHEHQTVTQQRCCEN